MLVSVPYSSSEDESGGLAKVAGRYQAPIPLPTHPLNPLFFLAAERRSNAMETNLPVPSAPLPDRSVHGYRQRIERR